MVVIVEAATETTAAVTAETGIGVMTTVTTAATATGASMSIGGTELTEEHECPVSIFLCD